MDKMERFQAAARGEKCDHPPVGSWIHFGSALWDPQIIADVHLRFFREYDWDYIKVMDDYRFPTVGGIVEATSAADLRAVGAPELTYENFDNQIEVLKLIRAGAEGAPILDTVFSPLQTLIRTLGDSVVPLLKENPDVAHEVLGNITNRLVEYIEATSGLMDGLYLSVNGATTDWHGWGLSAEEFTGWVAPYDKAVLAAAADRIRVMHVHGYELAPELVEDYPVEVMSWSHNQSQPTLAEVTDGGRFVPMGGLDELGALYWPPSRVRENVLRSRAATGDRIIVGPGCTVHSDTPPSILRALVDAAREPLA